MKQSGKMTAKANGNRPYQQCSISVMDTISDPNISFDEKGICNYYYDYLQREKEQVFFGKEAEEKLNAIVEKIKEVWQRP